MTSAEDSPFSRFFSKPKLQQPLLDDSRAYGDYNPPGPLPEGSGAPKVSIAPRPSLSRQATAFGKKINRAVPERVRNHIRRTKGPANIYNRPSQSWHELGLANLLAMHWHQLVWLTLLVFIVVALPFTVLIVSSGCFEVDDANSYLRLLAITFGGLGGIDTGDDLDEATVCVCITGMIQFMSLLLQGSVFSVIVTKLMSPQSDLRFSSSMAVITRNGQQMLSFRVVHPHGHCVTNLEVEAVWAHSETTDEGERYVRLDHLEYPVKGHVLFMPRTFTHVIDEQSPLWPYRDNIAEAHGQVMIHICGNDRHLNTEFCDAWLYNLPDVCHRGRHRWADLMDGTNVDGRPVGADLSKIDDVLHLEDEGGVETARATFFG